MVGRAAAALGAEVEQVAIAQVMQLREEKAATIAEIRVVGSELVVVVAQRQRPFEAAGQRREAAEMLDPFRVAQPAEPDPRRPGLVAPAQDVLREGCGGDKVEELLAQLGMAGRGPEARGWRHGRASGAAAGGDC